MWRKTISMTAILLLMVSMTAAPVLGNNGVIVIPNRFVPGGEEHPWGGGEQAITDPVAPLLGETNYTPLTHNFFIDLTIYNTWNTVKATLFEWSAPNTKKTEIIKMEVIETNSKAVRNR